jgi:hypothetical protein
MVTASKTPDLSSLACIRPPCAYPLSG